MRNAIIILVLLAPAAAYAQVTFPADSAYSPLRCNSGVVMTDAFDDATNARDERDVVGDVDHPAGLRASDGTNLYLRMRMEEDPAPGGQVSSFAWGMEYDVDNNPRTYEVLIIAEGVAGTGGTVNVHENTTTTSANSPSDPADRLVMSYPFADNARTLVAPGTTNGGNADFWIDFAVPWSVLTPLGLDRDTPVRVWVASSSVGNSLNGDFACHDGGTGAPTLEGTASDDTTGDPNDPGAGGGGGTGRLEGGGGCSTGAGAGWLVLAALGLVRRKRRAGRVRLEVTPRA
jgi:hypothetical protein